MLSIAFLFLKEPILAYCKALAALLNRPCSNTAKALQKTGWIGLPMRTLNIGNEKQEVVKMLMPVIAIYHQ